MSAQKTQHASYVDVGWGRLVFAHTFATPESVAEVLMDEPPDKRDIAFYVNDPQLILAVAPQDLFLDPSTTYRLQLEKWERVDLQDLPFRITKIETAEDIVAVNRIYSAVGMVPVDEELVWENRNDERFGYFLVRPLESDDVIGVALMVDHTKCFDDMFNSCSLWALAVDPQSQYPAVGVALVQYLANEFSEAGRSILDLSVLAENEAAVSLYESLGFERVPIMAIKRRNQINEPLFVDRSAAEGFNPYATIIIQEALRRGIAVERLNPERGFFRLSHGNRCVSCWESLTDLTSALAFCRCDDKRLTAEILSDAGLSVPEEQIYENDDEALEFLNKHQRIVIKPASGEQGKGVSVDLRDPQTTLQAIRNAEQFDSTVLMQQFVEGLDLRIVVINMDVVAAAVRKPAEIIGTGKHNIEQLLEKLSRRREAATDGESTIPLDHETERCVQSAGYTMNDVLPKGQVLRVRKTANLHTGGTIHDVTDQLSQTLREVACQAAAALEIPVVGMDFIVPNVQGDKYHIIEANERPGLANHEPQPTAERFIDLLFPHTANI